MSDLSKTNEKLSFLYDLLRAGGTRWFWTFNSDGSIVSSNCDDHILREMFFDNCFSYMMSQKDDCTAPLILSHDIGLTWGAVYEYDAEKLVRIHVIGPVFVSKYASQNFERSVHVSGLSVAVKSSLKRSLTAVPYVLLFDFIKELRQLYFCVTGRAVSISGIRYQRDLLDEIPAQHPQMRRDSQRAWMAEQVTLGNIRNGIIDDEDSHADLMQYMAVTKFSMKDELLRQKINLCVLAGLCVRAAIEGGLTPEYCYATGDNYMQGIVDAKSNTEAIENLTQLTGELTISVYNHKMRGIQSKQIAGCVDYINQHPDQPLSVAMLAKRVGYSSEYLSRRFKEETGTTIQSYINEKRIEKAKDLMLTSRLSIAEISDSLGFGNRNYFARVFKRYAGATPAQYIAENRRL